MTIWKPVLGYGTLVAAVALALQWLEYRLLVRTMVLATNGQAMMDYGKVLDSLTMLIAAGVVFIAIKRWRDQHLGGVIRFWPAFGLGVGIIGMASILYAGSWELAQTFAHIDFGNVYATAKIQQELVKGASREAMEIVSAEMEYFRRELYPNPIFRLSMSLAEIVPVGVLVSLVSAGLLRNPRLLPARR